MKHLDVAIGNLQRERLIRIIDFLKAGQRYGRTHLAEKLEVTPRTIQRDLDFLRDRLGAPIKYDSKAKGYQLTEPTWFLPQVSLTEGELFSLLIARQAMAQYRGTPVEKTLEQVFDKIAGGLKDLISIHQDYIGRGVLSFAPMPVLPVQGEIWNVLLRAAKERNTVKIRYQSLHSGNTRDRTVDPHHILNMQGDWYLFARDHAPDEIRQFQLHRILKAVPLEIPFTPDPAFDPHQIIDSSFGGFGDCTNLVELHLEIRGNMAQLLKDRSFHPRQITKTLPDGFELRFPVSAAGQKPFFNILQWILSMGRDVRVLAPDPLRQLLAAEVCAMADAHNTKINPKKISE